MKLFDMFTFNEYTVAFFKKNFEVESVGQLLVHPEKPKRSPLTIRENSLSFACKLQRFGFKEEWQKSSIPHQIPPLLEANFDPDDLVSRKVPIMQGSPLEECWKLGLTCSIFGSRSIRS
jgi:hypothetical protein